MTRSQLDIVKKSTYFFLVLTLGGSVMWLSSGGNVFRSDLVATVPSENVTNKDVVPTGVLFNPAGSTSNNVNSANVATSSSLLPSAPILNTNSSTPGVVLAPVEGFATLSASAPYSAELANPVGDNYSTENIVPDVPSNNTIVPANTLKKSVSSQVVTTTAAKAPKSGPETLLVLCFALLVTGGIFVIKQQRV